MSNATTKQHPALQEFQQRDKLEREKQLLETQLRDERRDHEATREQLALRDARIEQLEQLNKRLAERIDELEAEIPQKFSFGSAARRA